MRETREAIEWNGQTLSLLDQRRLPGAVNYIELDDAQAVAEAISDMVVRGAPAIGIAAAYGAAMSVARHLGDQPSSPDWRERVAADLETLARARPTAVNLVWAVRRMEARIDAAAQGWALAAREEAECIHAEDIAANRTMGEIGAAFIEGPCGVLTHCNAGALATGGYGTALGVVRSAYRDGRLCQVFADETRPWLQGARLTAWELARDGIPVQLLADGAASYAMRQGKVQWVVVGADRVARNGDVANKIGTYGLAVSARHHGVKFMVVAPTSTIDLGIAHGDAIPIEVRPDAELLKLGDQLVAAEGGGAGNPVFDVTPAALVDVLVTERGAIERPDERTIAAVMNG